MESMSPDPGGNESQSGPARISQRQPLSCTECTRRKTRCDKLVPCNNCRKRGVPEKCRIEQVIPSKTLSNVSQLQSLRRDMARSNAALTQRVAELERLVRMCLQKQGITTESLEIDMGQDVSDDGSEIEGDKNEANDEEAEAAATLEFLAIGRVRDKSPGGLEDSAEWTGTPPWATEGSTSKPDITADQPAVFSIDPSRQVPWPTLPVAAPYVPNKTLRSHRLAIQKDILARLPPRHVGKALVHFDIENVAWMHCCYHGPTLRNESDLFWSELGSDDVEVNWSFLALLFAVLSSAVHHLPSPMLASVFPNQSSLELIGVWYEACIVCLNEADWMRSHSLYAVQCISIIISAANHLGKGDSYYTLLGSAIKIAQALNLHRLGSDPDPSQIASRPHYVVAREVRKRTWWQLVIQDSFHVAFNGACSIHRSQFNTPTLIHYEEHPFGGSKPALSPISTDIPATDSHTYELLKLAVQINRAYTTASQLGPVPYETVLKIDTDMQAVRSQAPLWMRDETVPLDPGTPAWVEWQRRAYIISSAHKGIVLHRPYLGRAFRGDGRYIRSRETCLQHALKILQVFKGYSLESFRKTWTVLAHVVAACLVLMLDVSQDASIAISETLAPVQDAVQILRELSDVSVIAKNGVHVLSPLVEGSTHLSGGTMQRNAFAGQAERELKRALDIFRRGSNQQSKSASTPQVPTLSQVLAPSPASISSRPQNNVISPPDVDMSWSTQGAWPVLSPFESNQFEWSSFDFIDTYDENNPLSDMS